MPRDPHTDDLDDFRGPIVVRPAKEASASKGQDAVQYAAPPMTPPQPLVDHPTLPDERVIVASQTTPGSKEVERDLTGLVEERIPAAQEAPPTVVPNADIEVLNRLRMTPPRQPISTTFFVPKSRVPVWLGVIAIAIVCGVIATLAQERHHEDPPTPASTSSPTVTASVALTVPATAPTVTTSSPSVTLPRPTRTVVVAPTMITTVSAPAVSTAPVLTSAPSSSDNLPPGFTGH